jgi:predicted O-linked N-acetylglucosamine transferase (SPINDLY family)
MGAGRFKEAVLLLTARVRQAPADVASHYNLGFALQHLGRLEQAIEAYRRSAQLNPALAEACVNMGVCLQKLERLPEAEASFREALNRNPRLFQANLNLGLVLTKMSRRAESLAHFRAALALDATSTQAWDHLCGNLRALRRVSEAIEVFRRWEASAPETPELALAGLSMSRLMADAERERRYLELCLRWPFDTPEPSQIAEIIAQAQYFDVPRESLGDLYRRYQARMREEGFEDFSGQLRRTKGAQIRLGYLSPDFRTHVMGRLMRHVFQLHDRNRFDLYAFSLAEPRFEDKLTDDFRHLSTRFSTLAGLTDAQAARQIADHDLDILVDLAGHTAGGRPNILAHKPARVIITHMGYHGCIGIDQVDFKLTDSVADLPENERYQVERLLFMDTCVFPFDHVDASVPEGYSKASFGVEGRFVFGEFVNAMKLSPRLLAVWALIFERVPEAVLAFSLVDASDESPFRAAASRAGISPERLLFLPAQGDHERLRARYSVIDAVLDTFPYSGGDTTLSALDSGVPVVTLKGLRHSERTSASILAHLGLDELVAETEEDYVATAIRLATDPEFLARTKSRVLQSVGDRRSAGLGGYVRSLERAYEDALRIKGVSLAEQGSIAVDEFQTLFRTALAEHKAGNIEAALNGYETLLREQPAYPPLCYFLAMLLRSRGNTARARDLLRKAIQVSPSYSDARVALGNLELDEGAPAIAASMFRAVTSFRPERADGWSGLGLALQAIEDIDGAVEALARAASLAPKDWVVHYNLAIALQRARRYDAARESYRAALAIKKDSPETLFNYGLLLAELGRRDLAIGSWRAALAADPTFEPAYYQLRHALHASGRIDLWISNYEAYSRHCPDVPRLDPYAIDIAFHQGDLAEAGRRFRRAVEAALLERDHEVAAELLEELLYVALFFDIDESEMLALYGRYDAASRALHSQLPLLPPRETGTRIRIGYLSADFRDHVMGRMAFEILTRHDRAAFEVFGFSLSLQEDPWTGRVRSACDHYEVLAGMSERAAAEAIARHRLDLLVDLCTHTKGSRPAILAFKPARVQVTHVASAGALGLSAVDFKLTDGHWDVPGSQATLIEKLLPMEGCVFPYPKFPRVSQAAVSRFEIGIPDRAFVFGAFAQIQKLSPRLLSSWRQIMDRVLEAYIAFSPLSPGAVPAYQRLLDAGGIDPARALFIPQGSNEEQNLARYRHIDAVLDTFPYSGTNGTMEALSQGVPVVALSGSRACERSSLSILVNAGLSELVAPSAASYIDLAVRLAHDRDYQRAMRALIDERLPASVLADGVAHVRHLEEAYRRALSMSGVRIGK